MAETSKQGLKTRGSWRFKYMIGSEVEIYLDASNHVYIGHIYLCKGYFQAGLIVSLTRLATYVLNYHQRAPCQYTCSSFVPFGMIDCISKSELIYYQDK